MQRTSLKFISLVVLLITIFASVTFLRDDVEIKALQNYLDQMGFWAPVIFIALYAGATVLFLPGSVLTLAGGFIFGPIYGVIYNLTGAIIGSTLAFIIARYIASDWVAHEVGGKLGALIRGVEREGWRFVAVVRLVPLIPFNLLNYALGLTKISLWQTVIASAIFMAPGAIAYTYVGSLGQTALAGEMKELINQALIAFGLLILVASLPWIVKQIRGKKNINE